MKYLTKRKGIFKGQHYFVLKDGEWVSPNSIFCDFVEASSPHVPTDCVEGGEFAYFRYHKDPTVLRGWFGHGPGREEFIHLPMLGTGWVRTTKELKFLVANGPSSWPAPAIPAGSEVCRVRHGTPYDCSLLAVRFAGKVYPGSDRLKIIAPTANQKT